MQFSAYCPIHSVLLFVAAYMLLWTNKQRQDVSLSVSGAFGESGDAGGRGIPFEK